MFMTIDMFDTIWKQEVCVCGECSAAAAAVDDQTWGLTWPISGSAQAQPLIPLGPGSGLQLLSIRLHSVFLCLTWILLCRVVVSGETHKLFDSNFNLLMCVFFSNITPLSIDKSVIVVSPLSIYEQVCFNKMV